MIFCPLERNFRGQIWPTATRQCLSERPNKHAHIYICSQTECISCSPPGPHMLTAGWDSKQDIQQSGCEGGYFELLTIMRKRVGLSSGWTQWTDEQEGPVAALISFGLRLWRKWNTFVTSSLVALVTVHSIPFVIHQHFVIVMKTSFFKKVFAGISALLPHKLLMIAFQRNWIPTFFFWKQHVSMISHDTFVNKLAFLWPPPHTGPQLYLTCRIIRLFSLVTSRDVFLV